MGTAKRDRQRANRQQRLEELAKEAKRSKTRKWALWIGVAVPVAIVVLFLIARLGGSDDDTSTTVASVPASVEASTTTVDPTASTTLVDTSTTVAESTTTVALGPFEYGKGGCPAADGTSLKQSSFSQPFKQCIDPSKTYTATFDTSVGTIVVKLDTQTTPGTANNFVVLARYHYYDGTTIFRTAQSIGIVQGGAAHTNSSTDPGPGYSLPDEGFDYASLTQAGQAVGGPYKYTPGDLVMARTARPNGASAQFFFAVNDKTSTLDSQGVYVKFGTTTQGLDLLQTFLNSEPAETPVHPVTVNKVTITES